MSDSQWLSTAFFAYLASCVFYAVIFFKKEPVWARRSARILLLLGLGLHTVSLAVRVSASGYLPLSNMYESLVFFAWSLALAYLLTEIFLKAYRLGFFAVLFALAVMVYAFSHDSSHKPLMPALQSNWLLVHVTTCFLSYAAFAVSFLGSIVYLTPLQKKISSPEKLDLLIYRLILFGFPLLTFGVVSGAIWANEAWGVYWSWDPKETWALITWFVYALYLHLRLMQGWGGKKLAWIAFLGFLSVIFTYLGVAYFLPGLHSYA